MDRDAPAVIEFEHNHLEQIARPVRSECECPPRLVIAFFERIGGECMLDRMPNVSVGDPVPSR